jgi:peptidoglycan/xylan/chitin deacetylase (PgdA/CDA1 family)
MIADLPAGRGIDILMFHSIAVGPGPLCIAPSVFRDLLSGLEDRGFRGVSLRGLLEALGSGVPDLDRLAVLTFDDGYRDVEEEVYPEIARRGWGCTVFVPPGAIGSGHAERSWAARGRTLLDWPAIRALASAGMDVGAHGVSHRALPGLAWNDACREIEESGRVLEERTGRRPVAFAPPFGASTSALRREIARHYACSVGIAQGRARRGADLFDLPRIEMWYFRDGRRWRQYLERGSSPYFTMRKWARHARRLLG